MIRPTFKAAWNDNAVRTVDTLLVQAYRWHRCWHIRPMAATEALIAARVDVAKGKRRYPNTGKPYGAVCWQPGKPGIGFVHSLDGAGMRLVGRVAVECDGRRGIWDDSGKTGWLTDPYGDVDTGHCWGEVYQLPARDGKARFVAGYVMGGCSDDLPTVDLGTIYESADATEAREESAAQDAARAADHMAQRAAEKERDYQTAWQAGSYYSDTLEELATLRKSVLATLRDIKGACTRLSDLPDTVKARLRASIESDLETRADLQNRLASLAEGDGADRADYLSFYPDAEAKAAFNEGAGRAVLA